jgi:hypothetical protein
MGEFTFFMSQPVAIMFEDSVRSAVRKLLKDKQYRRLTPLFTAIGYVWVFLWFSYFLPFYIKSLTASDIIRDAVFGERPFSIGRERAWSALRSGSSYE